MDFSILSASRIDAKQYPCNAREMGLTNFQGKFGKHKTGPRAVKDVFEALLSRADGDANELTDNLLKADVCFVELASLTDKDLELMGCPEQNERKTLLDVFRQLPNQERSYEEIVKSKEAQLFNETILQRTYNHLNAMRSALSTVHYKLQIIPSEDVVIGEKNFASRFVLDALEELKRVTDEIDIQLDVLVKEAKLKTSSINTKDHAGQSKGSGCEADGHGAACRLGIFISAALGMWLGYCIWKAVKSK